MENQYEPIDKIINAVLKERLDTATAALEHGYASGYENGFDDAIANFKICT
jgi:hypothetical protein